MGLLKKSPEEAAAREQRKRELQAAKEREAFLTSPVGQARQAFERGDHVFQCAFDVIQQQAIIVSMVGSTTKKQTSDPTTIINAVCAEGWELVNGDFVFIQTGQQSRDKFLASGQNVAVAGTVMGYYLFRRAEGNRRADTGS